MNEGAPHIKVTVTFEGGPAKDGSGIEHHMFRFRCPICAATPPLRSLTEYLETWRLASHDRFGALLSAYEVALREISGGEMRWKTKRFSSALDKALGALDGFPRSMPRSANYGLHKNEAGELSFEGKCPVCRTESGMRRPDNYFEDWPHACGIQAANLLYEVGMILWAFGLGVSDNKLSKAIASLREESRRACAALSLSPCPCCSRPTTCIFGGDREDSTRGFCRWCAEDMGGVLTLAMARVSPNLPLITKRHALLPPEILR